MAIIKCHCNICGKTWTPKNCNPKVDLVMHVCKVDSKAGEPDQDGAGVAKGSRAKPREPRRARRRVLSL